MTGEFESADALASEPDLDQEQALRLIEALIFASAEPVTEATLTLRLPTRSDLRALMDELHRFYRFRGINLVAVGGGWIFRTAPDLAGLLAVDRVTSRKLSRAQIETLAIIAYHQPVTRGEIEEVRGVSLHKGTLDLLMEAGLVQPKGRRETPGRPATWVTTPEFLTHFGLMSLADLPSRDDMKAAGLLDVRPIQTLGEGAIADQDDADADDGVGQNDEL